MIKLKDNITGEKACYNTDISIKNIGKSLIFEFFCDNNSNNSYTNIYNGEIYKGDAVEVFIYLGEKDHYLELEVAPNGTLFLANIHNIDRQILDTQFLDNDILKATSSRDGNKWIVKTELDISKFNIDLKDIEINVLRIETDNQKSDKHLFALSPTLCGFFHCRKSFVKLLDYLDK